MNPRQRAIRKAKAEKASFHPCRSCKHSRALHIWGSMRACIKCLDCEGWNGA